MNSYRIMHFFFIITTYLIQGLSAHSVKHESSESEDHHLNKLSSEFIAYLSQFDAKNLALISTFIIQSIPVLLMSSTYKILEKYVKDSKTSKLILGMYSFTFGALIGDVFFHIFPSLNEHIYELREVCVHEAEKAHMYTYSFVMAGIIFCFLIEVVINNYFNCGHDHSNAGEEDDQGKVEEKLAQSSSKSLVSIAMLGDLFHNFTDGLAITSTFLMSTKLGIATSIAWFFHEIPHEIGDFAFLFRHNYTYFQAISYQMVTGLGAMIGSVCWLFFASKATIEMVAISGGTFIYLAMCMFMVEMRKSKSVQDAISYIVLMGSGMFIMYSLTVFE